jgi:hypothetical protein
MAEEISTIAKKQITRPSITENDELQATLWSMLSVGQMPACQRNLCMSQSGMSQGWPVQARAGAHHEVEAASSH